MKASTLQTPHPIRFFPGRQVSVLGRYTSKLDSGDSHYSTLVEKAGAIPKGVDRLPEGPSAHSGISASTFLPNHADLNMDLFGHLP